MDRYTNRAGDLWISSYRKRLHKFSKQVSWLADLCVLRLLTYKYAMAYAAYSPLTVTGSLGSYTRFPFYQTEGWPLAEHVCEGIIAQRGWKEKRETHFAQLQWKNGLL